MQPGLIVNRRGEVLGEHNGLPNYTIGQRKGLGFTTGTPMFVIEIDTPRNLLIVGQASDLERREFYVDAIYLVYGEIAAQTCGVDLQEVSRARGTCRRHQAAPRGIAHRARATA